MKHIDELGIISVKLGFRSDGSTYSLHAPCIYHYDPKIEISTDRKLTQDERDRVDDALVKAATREMLNIKEAAAR